MRGALKEVEGVLAVDIEAGDENFKVTYDPAKVQPDAIVAALHAAGETKAKLE